jgi:hypothetical protein
MTNDFETKLADLVWTLIEPKIEQKLAQFRDDLGTFDGDLDEKISDFLATSFRIEDYSFDLDGMIDQQVQYLAEDGDLKEWLDQEHEQFEEKVLNVLRTNTIRIEI